ncbi:hypothetical protein ACIF8W_18260 [Streptomyces sp. NPDC085639]|uniref:hypothetical protein n=1 Tax=Streptomyces sp. NPDC085639 TaxID=3365734 RepID=UPI0037D8EF89
MRPVLYGLAACATRLFPRLHGEFGDRMKCCGDRPGCGDRAQARAFVEATGVHADPLLGTGYRGWDDEFKDGWFDLESAVNAVTVQIEDETAA